MKKEKIILFVVLVAIIVLVIFSAYKYFSKENTVLEEKTDAEKFALEYTKLTNDNVFVYRNIDEIIRIFEHGTGIVYLGFPECPWCQEYVYYLNETAKEYGVEKIYYFNILEDRDNNTDNYLKLVDILDEYLQYDEEGNKRIYVPAVIAIKDGEILGFDDETSWDTKGYETPEEYWQNEDLEGLKNKFIKMFADINQNACSDCN